MQHHALKPIYAIFLFQLVICLNSPTVPEALNSAARDFKFLTCRQQWHCNLDQSALSTLHAARSVAALLGFLMGGRNPTQLQSKKDSCTLQLSVVANNSWDKRQCRLEEMSVKEARHRQQPAKELLWGKTWILERSDHRVNGASCVPREKKNEISKAHLVTYLLIV